MRPIPFVILLGLAAPSLALAAGVGANASQYIKSNNRPGPRPAWRSAAPELATSRLRAVKFASCGIDNGRAIDTLLAALKASPSVPEYPIAVVPGSSEGACHHCAWPQRRPQDPHWVEPNFRSRLRHAFLLLLDGVVHSVLISGGSIDQAHPEYNEAAYGFRELVSEYGALFKQRTGQRLEDRVIVDPFAIHSEVNLRNGDRLTRLLRLDRNIVVTETGSMKRQGWWFLHPHSSDLPFGNFDATCDKRFGYHLGELQELGKAPVFLNYAPKSVLDRKGVKPAQYLNSAGSHPEVDYIQSCKYPEGKCEAVDTVAIAHFSLRSTADLMAGGDARWDLGPKDEEFAKKTYAPDIAAVNRGCEALGKKLR